MAAVLATHWLILLAACLLSFVLTWLFTLYARKAGMLDLPGARHSHTEPTPRGGGAGMVIALALLSWMLQRYYTGTSFWLSGVLPGLLVLSLLGWWDDRMSLSPLLRFVVQLAVSSYLIWWVCVDYPLTSVLMLAISWLYLMWMINLYNFMDGSNGMAGFQGVFTGLVLAFLFFIGGNENAALLSVLVAAVCLGFLPWNLGQARVFMGDVASGSLGFVIGALLIYGVISESLAVGVAWLVMLVFVCDSTLTLTARVLRGERWYNPHKQHLYQRLIERGWSHGRVLTLYQLINLVLVVPAIAVAVNYPASATIVAIAVSGVLGLGWLLVKHKLGVLAQAG